MKHRSMVYPAVLLMCLFLVGSPAGSGDSPRLARPFALGEKLVFSVRYEFIRAGIATMHVSEVIEHRGRSCYRIVSEAKSTSPFSLFFEVNDRVESLMDEEELYTWRYEKDLKEGKFHAHELVVFDQESNTATYSDGKVVPVPERVQDVLTSLYYVRTLNLEVGKSVFIDNHADGKNYPLEVKVIRTERIDVPAGTFDCLVVEPILKASGIFQHKGRLTVWLSKDSLHIPVMMKSKVVIGSIVVLLQELDLGSHSGG